MRFSRLAVATTIGLASTMVTLVPAAAQASEETSETGLAIDSRALDLDQSIPIAGSDVKGSDAALLVGNPGASENPDGASMLVIRDYTGDLELSIRSLNSGEWSEWSSVESSENEAPDSLAGEEGYQAEPVAIGPIWIGDASQVEIVKTGGAAASLTVDFVTDNSASLATSASVTSPTRPNIRPRSDWAGPDQQWASENGTCAGGPFYADGLQVAIVHHTVTTNNYSQAQAASLIRGIYYTHVRVNGWCDVAYNFLIDKYGTIWQGRSGDEERPVIGGHARGFNTNAVGISLLGQYQQGASPSAARPTGAEIGALEALVGWKLGLHGIDPQGTTWLKNRAHGGVMRFGEGEWVKLPTVIGHRDVGRTSCPGSYAYPSVLAIRGRLAPGRVGSGPYDFPQWQAAAHGPALITVESGGGIRSAFAGPMVSPAPGPLNGGEAVAIGGNRTSGYVLLSDGSLEPYGTAPAIAGNPGGAGSVDMSVRSDGTSGWILNGNRLIGFGGAASINLAEPARAVDLDDAANGYALSSSGSLLAIGTSPEVEASNQPVGPAVDLGVRTDRASGWVVYPDGQITGFGGAASDSVPIAAGSARSVVASPTGLGGWVMNADGEIIAFGDERPAIPQSTHVGVPVAVDMAVTDYISGDDLRSINDGAYVDALAQVFLGRPATDIELDVWVSQLDFKSSIWLTTRLATSDEYAGQFVDQTYWNALGRAPDAEGREYWLGQIRNGLAPQELGIYFYGSKEFFLRSGSASNYVDRLYEILLFREPDKAGHSYWLSRLERGRSVPVEVASEFYASIESRRDRISKLYVSLLSRSPEPEGLDYWADRLYNEGDFALAAEIATSKEFYLRAQSN